MGVDRHLVARVDCPTSVKSLPPQEGCVKKAKSLPTIGIYRPPAARRLEAPPKDQESATSEEVTPVAAAKTDKQRSTRRRPDIQVYVPRAKRALIGDTQSQNEPGNKNLVCSERRSSSSSQKQGHSTDTPASQVPHTEQFVIRPPEDEDKLSCNEVSNKETGRSRQLQRRHFGSKNCVHNDDDSSFSEDKLLNGSISSCTVANNVESNILESSCSQNSDNQKINYRNGVSEHMNFVEFCGDSTHTHNENRSEHFENGVENLKECSVVSPSDNSGNGFVEDSDKNMECKKPSNNSDDLVSSNRVGPQTELRDNMQCLDIRDDGKYNTKKDSDDECRKEENRRTRRILRRNFMSDVLIISDVPVDADPSVTSSDYRVESSEIVEMKCLPDEKSTVENETMQQEENTENISSAESPKLNPEECTWDMMFDDSGECLDPKLMEELTRAVGSVAIEKPQSDYRSYQSKLEMFMSGSGDEFAHVIEIYNFPAEFKTEDLLSIFSPYRNGGFEIKWVDDTHALGVFSSSRVAAEVLSHEHPLVKTRPLSQATHESRAKARRVAEFLQPYRVRPETCAALARRLVTGALGVRLRTSQEEREAERRLLREAREKKRLAAKQREAAWEGTFSEHNKTI